MSLKTHRLSNGLRIVTEHMPSMESASIGVWVQAGGRHERLEQNGIAPFLEHMAFKGTARRSPLEIAEVLENVGGYLNAYTSRETTAYYARVLKEDVPLALDVIADIVLNPVDDYVREFSKDVAKGRHADVGSVMHSPERAEGPEGPEETVYGADDPGLRSDMTLDAALARCMDLYEPVPVRDADGRLVGVVNPADLAAALQVETKP